MGFSLVMESLPNPSFQSFWPGASFNNKLHLMGIQTETKIINSINYNKGQNKLTAIKEGYKINSALIFTLEGIHGHYGCLRGWEDDGRGERGETDKERHGTLKDNVTAQHSQSGNKSLTDLWRLCFSRPNMDNRGASSPITH